jgi:hypothetical protein
MTNMVNKIFKEAACLLFIYKEELSATKFNWLSLGKKYCFFPRFFKDIVSLFSCGSPFVLFFLYFSFVFFRFYLLSSTFRAP